MKVFKIIAVILAIASVALFITGFMTLDYEMSIIGFCAMFVFVPLAAVLLFNFNGEGGMDVLIK